MVVSNSGLARLKRFASWSSSSFRVSRKKAKCLKGSENNHQGKISFLLLDEFDSAPIVSIPDSKETWCELQRAAKLELPSSNLRHMKKIRKICCICYYMLYMLLYVVYVTFAAMSVAFLLLFLPFNELVALTMELFNDWFNPKHQKFVAKVNSKLETVLKQYARH